MKLQSEELPNAGVHLTFLHQIKDIFFPKGYYENNTQMNLLYFFLNILQKTYANEASDRGGIVQDDSA